MTSAPLTTTSYAILGLLAVQPWSTYELTQQMDRSLGRYWPRATSKLYEEPKKLVREGLARATERNVGRRPRTEYSITTKGRRVLAKWLQEPGSGPVLEFEQLVQVFFADHGTRADALATLDAARAWAISSSAAMAAVGSEYLEGRGAIPGRAAQLNVSARFLIDFYALVGDWAEWARREVEGWPEDPSDAEVSRELVAENQRRALAAATRPPTR